MDFETGEQGGETPAALLIADGDGRFFAIALADLQRFRVPDGYRLALDSLTRGAEPQVLGADVRGFAESALPDGTQFLLDRLFGDRGAWNAMPAARRLRVWALLR